MVSEHRTLGHGSQMSLKEKYSHQGWHSCQDRKSPVPNSCAMASGPDGRLADDSTKFAEREPASG